jgi:hypothetical protein
MSPADLAGRRFRLASPRTALALGILFAVVVLALVPLSLLAKQSPQVNGGEALGAVPFGVVGFVLAWRVPRNPIGWLFMAIGICLLLMVGVYAGLVLLITQVLGFHTEVAVAVATLAAAALVNPVRRRVQHAVDRRFNRARYDADRIVGAFAAGAAGRRPPDRAHGQPGRNRAAGS